MEGWGQGRGVSPAPLCSDGCPSYWRNDRPGWPARLPARGGAPSGRTDRAVTASLGGGGVGDPRPETPKAGPGCGSAMHTATLTLGSRHAVATPPPPNPRSQVVGGAQPAGGGPRPAVKGSLPFYGGRPAETFPGSWGWVSAWPRRLHSSPATGRSRPSCRWGAM